MHKANIRILYITNDEKETEGAPKSEKHSGQDDTSRKKRAVHRVRDTTKKRLYGTNHTGNMVLERTTTEFDEAKGTIRNCYEETIYADGLIPFAVVVVAAITSFLASKGRLQKEGSSRVCEERLSNNDSRE